MRKLSRSGFGGRMLEKWRWELLLVIFLFLSFGYMGLRRFRLIFG
jgi:hypothetical protein